jgi:hypothetical protein
MIDLAWSFAPWIIFALAAKSTSYPAAVIGAIVVAAVVIGRAIARHHVHLLDAASGACFLVLAPSPWRCRRLTMLSWPGTPRRARMRR